MYITLKIGALAQHDRAMILNKANGPTPLTPLNIILRSDCASSLTYSSMEYL